MKSSVSFQAQMMESVSLRDEFKLSFDDKDPEFLLEVRLSAIIVTRGDAPASNKQMRSSLGNTRQNRVQ
jgi:hypothetical protein